MEKYGKAHAEEILRHCRLGEYLTIDDRGVWSGIDRDDMLRVETDLLRWKPARVFQNDPNAPDVADTPALPFPFSAKKLAAFMLAGVGAFVADFYGEWQDGPDPDSLGEIDTDCNLARAALAGAYAAYRDAHERIGVVDQDYWIEAMVRQLLEPDCTQHGQDAPAVAVAVKKWTAEKLAELSAYRESHTMPETVQRFGITGQRIRQLLPSKKQKAEPFSGLIHRM